MKVTKAIKYVEGSVSNTQITYTKSPIQGQVDTLLAQQPLRLQFKASDIQMCDLSKSTLNFTLDITQKSGQNKNMLVPNESVIDLFEVLSVTWNGVRLNMQQQNYAGMLYRRVASKCNAKQYLLTTGQQQEPHRIDINGTGDFAYTSPDTTAVVGGTIANTVGIFPDVDFRGVSRFGTPGAKIPSDFSRMIGEQERYRLISECVRHYTRTANALTPTYVKMEDTTSPSTANVLKQYSIKLGELVPELATFQVVDKSLFSGSGLEIQLQLLSPLLCMQKLPLSPALAVLSSALTGRSAEDTYQISNIFMGMVYHKTASEKLGLFKQASFTSVFHTRQGLSTSSVNHQFSLNAGCFVRGLIVIYSPNKQLYEGANGTNTPIPAFGSLGSQVPPHTHLSKAYFQPMQITETMVQIGNQAYPAVQAPPTGSKQNWYYQVAQAYSEQVMGYAYSTSLERFLTIDYAQFIPVGRIVDQGELFQFYQSFTAITQAYANDIELNIFAVCDRIIEFDDDGTVRIENLKR